ncbi:MAG: tetratricopeptide repeat protein [Alphaproteobacteria bacterium]
MTEHNLFAEVQADLERQKLEALWKKYGIWVVVVALGIVLATAGSTAYRSWNTERNERLTSGLMDASKSDTDAAKGIELLQKFADENPGTHQGDFALLRAGALAVDQNDKIKAIGFFDAVAQDSKADPAFRQLGDLLSVQTQMDNGDPTMLSARLQPLTEELAPWRFSALEAQGYLALRAGDKAKARQIFADLSQDARAPQSIGARATDILRSLN